MPKEKPPHERTAAEQDAILEREHIVERYEALLIARVKLAEALDLAIAAHNAVQSTGLAPAHILEPLRTVVDLTRQSHARVIELLARVPL